MPQRLVCFVVRMVKNNDQTYKNNRKAEQKGRGSMASIRKRGENSYLIVVSRGYDYEGNRLKSGWN